MASTIGGSECWCERPSTEEARGRSAGPTLWGRGTRAKDAKQACEDSSKRCEAGLQACEDANKCGEAGWRLVGPSFGDTQAETDRSNGSEAGAQVSGQRCEQKMRSGSAGE